MPPLVKIFYPNAIVHNDLTLTQLENEVSPEFNWSEMSYTPPGSVYPQFTGLESQKPEISSSTTQVTDVIKAMTHEGVALPMDDSKMEWQQGKNLATREAAVDGKHTTLEIPLALFFWKSIQAGESGFAKIDFCLRPVLDDAGNPAWIPSFDQPLDANPGVTEMWYTGPVVLTFNDGLGGLNQTLPLCNDGWSWDNNIELEEKMCAGEDAPKYMAVKTVSPTAKVPTENLEHVLSLHKGGSIVSVDFYLRRAVQGGAKVDPALAQHFRISSVVGTARAINSGNIGMALHSWTYTDGVIIPA